MSRIQSRLSDHRAPSRSRPLVNQDLAPTVIICLGSAKSPGADGWATETASGDQRRPSDFSVLGRDAIGGNLPHEVPVLRPGQVIECHYRLMDFDLLSKPKTSTFVAGNLKRTPSEATPTLRASGLANRTDRKARRESVAESKQATQPSLGNRFWSWVSGLWLGLESAPEDGRVPAPSWQEAGGETSRLDDRHQWGGDEKSGQRTRLSPVASFGNQAKIRAIENSVLWQTTGKGDTDFGVHFFERRKLSRSDESLLYQPYLFRTVCPNSPKTYHGQLISIEWLVRIRVYVQGGECFTFEQKFEVR